MNNVVLVSQIRPPLTLALSVLILKERINKWIVLGSSFAVIGVILTVILQSSSEKDIMMLKQPILQLGTLLIGSIPFR